MHVIKLEDFNNRSLDDIIELYRSGYSLENIPQYSIRQLQLPPNSLSATAFLAGALSGLILMLILRGKLKRS